MSAEHTADSQYEATPPGAGYEHTDARVGIIVKFLIWLSVIAIVIHVGLGFLFRVFVNQRVEEAPRRYPMATSGPRQPPEPRLQRFPREDVLTFRLAEEQALNTYGWVDKAAGIVHIPIEDAMKLALQRGLPTRRPTPGEPERGSDPSRDVPGVRPPALDPEPMPSDASGGRRMEAGR
jgi:hypothetical protein